MSEQIKILITLPFADSQIAKLEELSPRFKIEVIPANKVEDIPEDVWKSVEVLYTNRVLPDPEKTPDLRWIQFHWAGVEQILDASILRKENLVATTLSGAAATQMAEYIVMMILALGHRLPDLMAAQRKTEWPRDRWERFLPLELRGSTVGVVGYGSIGRQVAHLLQPFGAFIVANKLHAMHPEDKGYVPAGMGDPDGDLVFRLYPAQALRSMLKECDFVVITVPKTEMTKNMFGADEFEAMKPTAFLIDVSRGGIIETKALINALKEQKIAGAALDVFDEEPLPSDSPLWKLPNLMITPHISGNTPYYNERAVELFTENLLRYLADLPLFNRIDLEQGY